MLKPAVSSVTGFQPINVEIIIPQQAITVVLGNAIPGQGLLTVHGIKIRLTINNGA
ncbi:Uncharacterised protein [Pantoea agglomerans]|uniref:Uncharacterized protein n=1 Tax=Enterobacter agglomerans TaxID=549 RepID=A0A379AEQ3_ENTAG|nr:Uncharacterised protein [Pantoea agglomerans]